jgi:hypothetical protein
VVHGLVAQLDEPLDEPLLELEAGMVGPQVNTHVLQSLAWPRGWII